MEDSIEVSNHPIQAQDMMQDTFPALVSSAVEEIFSSAVVDKIKSGKLTVSGRYSDKTLRLINMAHISEVGYWPTSPKLEMDFNEKESGLKREDISFSSVDVPEEDRWFKNRYMGEFEGATPLTDISFTGSDVTIEEEYEGDIHTAIGMAMTGWDKDPLGPKRKMEAEPIATKENSLERIIEDTITAHERDQWSVPRWEGEAVKSGSIEHAIQIAKQSISHGQGIPGYQLSTTHVDQEKIAELIISGKIKAATVIANANNPLPGNEPYEISVDAGIEHDTGHVTIYDRESGTILGEAKLDSNSPEQAMIDLFDKVQWGRTLHGTDKGTIQCTGVNCSICKDQEIKMPTGINLAMAPVTKYSKSQIGQALANQRRAIRAGRKLKRKLEAHNNKVKGYDE